MGLDERVVRERPTLLASTTAVLENLPDAPGSRIAAAIVELAVVHDALSPTGLLPSIHLNGKGSGPFFCAAPFGPLKAQGS